jgi:hypothetical protein
MASGKSSYLISKLRCVTSLYGNFSYLVLMLSDVKVSLGVLVTSEEIDFHEF